MKRRTARGLAKAAERQADGVAAATDGGLDGYDAFVARLTASCPPDLVGAVTSSLDAPPALVARLHGDAARQAAARQRLISQEFPMSPLDADALDDATIFVIDVPSEARRAVTDSAPVRDSDVYLMNPSSLLPGLALGPGPDDAVLDLCAAPGGKTLHLATLMGRGAGSLTAVEAVKPRFFKLRGQLQRFGEGHVKTYLKDGRVVGKAVGERFDRILVDAPCSSEARIRRDDPDSHAQWSPRKVRECQHKQLDLLRSGLDALRPGGRLVYCTCSFSPEENEEVVDVVLAERAAEVRLVPTGLDALRWSHPPALRGGIAGSEHVRSLTRRVWPDALWDGFFVAAFEKNSDAN